jgi:hypothetical protein
MNGCRFSSPKEHAMRNLLVKSTAIAVLVSGSVLGSVYAQQHDHAAPAVKPAAAVEHRPEVFCGTMKTGQLCSLGTATLLGLTPENREAWLAAVRVYNREVNAAITKLQGQAKTTLSPAQIAEVNSWFAVGINPQINQLLLATTKPAGAK